MIENVLVSIIIPVYNRSEQLFRLVRQLSNQSYSSLELIIVDDYSEDHFDALRNIISGIKMFRCNQRSGPAFAKNLGAMNALGKYLLFLDSDIEVIDDDCIKKMVEISQSDGSIGELGGELALGKDCVYTCGANITFDGKTTAKNVLVGDDNRSELYLCDFVPTSNCFVSKDMFFKVGGFDPYFLYLAEDKDLGYRIKKLGYSNYFSYNISVKHNFCSTYSYKNGYHYFRARLQFAVKHKGLLMFFVTCFFDLMRSLSVCWFHLRCKFMKGDSLKDF